VSKLKQAARLTPSFALQLLPPLIKSFHGSLRFLQRSAGIGQGGVAGGAAALDFRLPVGNGLFGR